MATIRLATAADAKAIADIYGRVVSTSATTFELEPPTEAEMAARIATLGAFAPWLVCERRGEVLGYVYASRHRERAAYQWSVEVAVYIREDSHRQGVGRALYTSLFACLRLQGFYAAHAGATLPNSGSVGLHEAMGFVKIGVYPAIGFKLGAWHDVGWWQLALRERKGTPVAPLSMAVVMHDPGWAAAVGAGLGLLRP